MMKISNYIKFNQSKNAFYMVSIKIEDLLDNYTIDLYDQYKNPNGYQRPIQNAHKRKIIEYLNKEENPILNTAILAAVDFDALKEIDGKLTFEKELKIVDGQHRIEAFKELQRINPEKFREKFYDYEVPIILMRTDKKKIIEMETFVNINNKNKRVNTALAEFILESIRKEKKPDYYGVVNLTNMDINERKDFVNSVGNRVTLHLNEEKSNIWYKKIKTGDDNTKNRVISSNTFNNSLRPIIDNYIRLNYKDEIHCAELVEDLYNMVIEIWEIAMAKWPDCFDIKYYNIQKGIGVYSIHNIFAMCILQSPEDYKNLFKNKINNSLVISEDWWIGGKFSPLNSKSGMKEIERYILNEINNIGDFNG